MIRVLTYLQGRLSVLNRTPPSTLPSRLLVAAALVMAIAPSAFAAEADTTAVASKRPRPTASAPT
jgi:hypothetical protein